MKILILAVGKIKGSVFESSANEYFKRINRYYPTKLMEINSINDAKKIAKIGDLTIACDETGKHHTSSEFANFIQTKLMNHKRLIFLVGGAEGIGAFKKQANFVLSLSKLTLQHDLARTVLLEQIYRACTIIKGEPYHR